MTSNLGSEVSKCDCDARLRPRFRMIRSLGRELRRLVSKNWE